MLDSWNLSITAEEFTASCACYLHHSLLPQTITDLLVNYRVIILRLTLLEKNSSTCIELHWRELYKNQDKLHQSEYMGVLKRFKLYIHVKSPEIIVS